jgi:hypothetical protein
MAEVESHIRHALEQAPDATCELRMYGGGVVAVCE